MDEVYSLTINSDRVVVVEVERPSWLRVKPVVDKNWLRFIVASALNRWLALRS